jgi:hypothetical protein
MTVTEMTGQSHHLRARRWLSIIISLAGLHSAVWAHGVVGKRMFVEPLFAEDANIKNELTFRAPNS